MVLLDREAIAVVRDGVNGHKNIVTIEGKILYSFPKSMSDAHIWSAVDFAMRMCALVEQEYTRPKKLPL